MKKKITLTIFIIITIVLTVLIWIFFFGKESKTVINPQRNVAQMEMPPFDFNFNTQSEIESSTVQSVSSSQKSEQASFDNTQSIKDLKGIWLSYIDIKALILNKTEDEFKNEFSEACKLIRSIGLNTLIIQVRPFSDAIYKSKIYPWSHILTGKQGQDPGYDPLNIIIKIAKENNLAVHAWINPYRIKTSDIELAENNPAKAYLSKEETKNKVKNFNGGLYYNMADEVIINLITNGVAELCENYDISGIHFDDYFYPTTDDNFDKIDYENYKNNNGQLKLEDWRRDNVTKLIKSVYDKIKAINKNISFGISPSGDYEKAQNSMYADLNKWLSQDGYVDYICPQIYYGFNNQSLPFEQTKNMWVDKTKAESVKLIVGLPFYKSGGEDLWAGSGKNEFKENSNIITKMIESIKKNDKISGYILYDYNHIKNLNTISSKEFEGLKQLNKK